MAIDNVDAVLNAIHSGKGYHVTGEDYTFDILIPALLSEKDAAKIRKIQRYVSESLHIELRLVAGRRGCSRLVFQTDSTEEVIKVLQALARDPKLLSLVKELGGSEFRIITGQPYQSVQSVDTKGIEEAAAKCEKYVREEQKRVSIEIVKDPNTGKVLEILEEGRTIHKELRTGDFVGNFLYLENEMFASESFEEQFKTKTLQALEDIRKYFEGKDAAPEKVEKAKSWLSNAKDEIAVKLPKAVDFLDKVLRVAEKVSQAYS